MANVMSNPQPNFSLYIHWPFCVSKCPYCDFNSHVRDQIDVDAWETALLADLRHEQSRHPEGVLQSIFFGGGTPSLMPPAVVAALIEEATTFWSSAPNIEITLEANPSSVEAARFADLAHAGINRVSLGLQSLDDAQLQFLGRAHDVQEGLAALDIAQSCFARVNIDLIYALPGDTGSVWQAALNRAIALGTDHMSLYQLTIEPGTRFATMVEKRAFDPLDADTAATLFELTADITDAAGLPLYEISNHARKGSESRHNLGYWHYQNYLGIGPGAHGRREGVATMRHKKPENFLSAVTRNGNGLQAEDILDAAKQAREALVMGLRLRDGVDLGLLGTRFGFAPSALMDLQRADRLVTHGLVARDGNRLKTTAAGRLLLDQILVELVSV